MQSKGAPASDSLGSANFSTRLPSLHSLRDPKAMAPPLAIVRPTPITLPAAISNSLAYVGRPVLPWEQKGAVGHAVAQKGTMLEEEAEEEEGELDLKIGGLTIDQLEADEVNG